MRNLLAGAVVALTLAGCAVQPPLALTDGEIRDYSGMMQDRSWYDVGGETRPLVEPTLVPAGDMEQVLPNIRNFYNPTSAQNPVGFL